MILLNVSVTLSFIDFDITKKEKKKEEEKNEVICPREGKALLISNLLILWRSLHSGMEIVQTDTSHD